MNKNQNSIGKEQKLQKQQLQENLKQIIDQIKQTYFQFLSSLKFENINDKLTYKQTMKHRAHQRQKNGQNQSIFGYDRAKPNQIQIRTDINEDSGFMYGQKMDEHAQQNINQLQRKTFSFQEQLAVQNKGYMAFIRLIKNIKQLQDYNHHLRSIVMNSDTQGHLQMYENDLVQDLKRLQIQIPNSYFVKKV